MSFDVQVARELGDTSVTVNFTAEPGLTALFGERASLTLSSLAPAGVRAEMRVPCAC